MSGGIYLIHNDGRLVEMSKEGYNSEDLLQGLLAQYPNLLAGDQVDTVRLRRWLLISRETGVPSEEGGTDRWSVDHLFLDQDAVPTIVEVKRSSDTRVRREVVGQMLDYAANAVVYWPVEVLKARFEAECEARGVDDEALIEEFLGVDVDQEDLWQKAKTNLQAGKVRLIFVADEIPSELRRVVEFLNEQMDPAEVLAVEIEQYVGGDLKTLVPRLVGQTAEAQRKKASPALEARQWDEPSFFQALEERTGTQEVTAARRILEWARVRGLKVGWGKGRLDGSFTPEAEHGVMLYKFIRVYTYGSVEILFEYLYDQPPFDDESVRRELLRRLNEIPGTSISVAKITMRPTVSLGLLKEDAVIEQFLGTLDWIIEEIRAS
jgi:hypothetical protein